MRVGVGSVLRRLSVAEGVERTPRAVQITAASPPGLALFGPLGALAPGDYELGIQGRAAPGLAIEVVVLSREGVLASAAVLNTGDSAAITIRVTGAASTPAAFGLRAPGGGDVEILDVTLS